MPAIVRQVEGETRIIVEGADLLTPLVTAATVAAGDAADAADASAASATASAGSATAAAATAAGLASELANIVTVPTPVIADDDKDPWKWPALKTLARFFESATNRVRSAILENGFAGKYFAFLYYGTPADDERASIWAIELDDGKRPFRIDRTFKVYLKLQDAAITYVTTRIAALAALAWRPGGTVEDLRQSPKLIRALKSDTTINPAFYGEVSIPVSGTTTQAVASGAGVAHLIQFTGQSTADAAGADSSQLTANWFPYHVVKFSAGSAGTDSVATDIATLNDLAVAADSQKPRPSIACSFAHALMDRAAGIVGPAYLIRADNKGGAPITDLVKGGGSYVYANMLVSMAAAYAELTTKRGLQLRVTVHNNQGETSGSTKVDGTYTGLTIAAFQGYVSQWVDDLIADIPAQAKAEPVIIDSQTIGTAAGTNWYDDNFNGPYARLIEGRLRRGTGYLTIGPRYDMPVGPIGASGDLHPLAEGQLIEGACRALVDRRWRARNPYPVFDIARKNTPALFVGDVIRAAGVAETTSGSVATPTKITALGTGSGGTGTYTVNNSQTVSRRKMHAFGAIFWGTISGTTLTVDEIEEGALDIAVSGSTVTIRTTLPVMVDAWIPSVGAALGFSWTDDSGKTISSVAVDRDTITITLSGTPTTNRVLGYADVVCGSGYRKSDALNGTASFSGTTMTVTAISASTIAVGDPISAQGIAPNTYVTALGTGTGGTGTYTLSTTNSLSSRNVGVRWNWPSTRGQIMHDTGIAQPFWSRGFKVPRTIRFGLPRFRTVLP